MAHRFEWIRLHGQTMGTTWAVDAAVPLTGTSHQGGSAGSLPIKTAIAQTIDSAINTALDTLIDQMSTWTDDSTISRLSRAATGWYQVEPEFWRVLTAAYDVARLTDGAYDPTLLELVNLWGFGPAGPCSAPPDPKQLRNALLRSSWRKMALNHDHRGVWQPGGLHFDLSSIAKGFGVDEIARVLNEQSCPHYLIELGGELAAQGLAPDGHPWRLNIDLAGLPINLFNRAVATSGDYRRCFEYQGRRYAHTLDARTGQPLHHNLASVTVLHDNCTMADAWATALLCLGPEHGPAMAETHGLAALFLERGNDDFKVWHTAQFARQAGLLIGNDRPQ